MAEPYLWYFTDELARRPAGFSGPQATMCIDVNTEIETRFVSRVVLLGRCCRHGRATRMTSLHAFRLPAVSVTVRKD
jgi:hypothetical protein